jgi:hypothetical protein
MKTVVQVSNESTDSVSSSAGNVTTKFQKLMLLGGGTGQVVVNVGGDGGGSDQPPIMPSPSQMPENLLSNIKEGWYESNCRTCRRGIFCRTVCRDF